MPDDGHDLFRALLRSLQRARPRESPRESSSDLVQPDPGASLTVHPTLDGPYTATELIMKTIGGDGLAKIN
jgi:hypothetical protein